MSNTATLDLSWHPHSIAWQDNERNLWLEGTQEAELLPDIPQDYTQVRRIYLPCEQLLVRAMSFALPSPSLVDSDMLFQELCEEITDAEPEQWWLAWHMDACDAGVAGMVFGLPEAWRQRVQATMPWSQTPCILVDVYERLQQHITPDTAAAIMNQDDEGVFFGYFDGKAWRGMRRINAEHLDEHHLLDMWKSLHAMGFKAQEEPVHGFLDSEMQAHIEHEGVAFQGDTKNTSISRHAANLALGTQPISPLNVRHGRWSALQAWQQLSFWKRSILLSCVLLLTWGMGSAYQLHQWNQDIEHQQQRIEAAFHLALPDERVMLDPLAQLKKAAGNDTTTSIGLDFLSDLNAVGQVYAQHPWHLDALSMRDGKMSMRGSVDSIATLNHIQAALSTALQHEVHIVDTQMGKQRVSFRMSW